MYYYQHIFLHYYNIYKTNKIAKPSGIFLYEYF